MFLLSSRVVISKMLPTACFCKLSVVGMWAQLFVYVLCMAALVFQWKN